ncbi:MAG: HD domain-containing protein [Planctomycetota bacterium]
MDPKATLLDRLLALLPLDRLPRTGWILRGVPDPESVAGHILGTAHLALALGPRVDPPLELERVLAMALVHDAPEALTGDLPRTAAAHLPPGAKHAMEGEIARELVQPLSTPAARAWSEYQARETREARFVALCDRLQLGVRWVGYRREGRSGLEEFRKGLAELDCEGFPPARALLDEILEAAG